MKTRSCFPQANPFHALFMQMCETECRRKLEINRFQITTSDDPVHLKTALDMFREKITTPFTPQKQTLLLFQHDTLYLCQINKIGFRDF